MARCGNALSSQYADASHVVIYIYIEIERDSERREREREIVH